MTITIDDSKCGGLNAVVAKVNAERAAAATEENPAVEITPAEYLTARVEEALASYDQQLIDEAKRQYDEVVTIAATLSPEKQAILIAKVQELAADS